MRVCVLTGPVIDPNAPKPEGSTITPTTGEQLIVSLLSTVFVLAISRCSLVEQMKEVNYGVTG